MYLQCNTNTMFVYKEKENVYDLSILYTNITAHTHTHVRLNPVQHAT